MLEPSLHRWRHTVLDVSCRVRLSSCHIFLAFIIERVQQRFTKRLPGFGNYSYCDRLRTLQLPSLELRRLHIDLIWGYKIIFGHVSLSPSYFFLFQTR